MMKDLFVTLLLIAAPVVCFAESTLHYTYDETTIGDSSKLV